MTFMALRNGPVLPWPVVELAIDLDLRGYRFAVSGPDTLRLIPPKGVEGSAAGLSDEERSKIKQWKTHLLALVAYEPPAPIWQTSEASVA